MAFSPYMPTNSIGFFVMIFGQRMRDSISFMCCHRQDRQQADIHRMSAFRWVRIPNPMAKRKTHTEWCGFFFLAEDEGFEPPQTESESGVLPLHKSSIAGTFIIIRTFFEKSRTFLKNFEISDGSNLPQKVPFYSSHGKGFPAKTWFFRY